jgi:hypothetical protein
MSKTWRRMSPDELTNYGIKEKRDEPEINVRSKHKPRGNPRSLRRNITSVLNQYVEEDEF